MKMGKKKPQMDGIEQKEFLRLQTQLCGVEHHILRICYNFEVADK